MALSGTLNSTTYQGRGIQFYWTATQDIGSNSSTISWTLKGYGNAVSSWYKSGNFKVLIDGSQEHFSSTRIQLYDGTLVASGTKTIWHNNDGTRSFNVYIEAGIYANAVNCSGNTTFYLDNIPRQATLTWAPDFNDEENPIIWYSNPAGNSASIDLQVCISLDGSRDDITYRPVDKGSDSYTFYLTDDERNVLRNATTTSNSRYVTFFLRTVIGGVTYYSTQTKVLSIINANPSLDGAWAGVAAEDSQSLWLTNNDYNTIVKHITDIWYEVNPVAQKGAWITEQWVSSGSRYNNSLEPKGLLENVDNGVEHQYLWMFVRDSRGNTAQKSIPFKHIDYIPVTCSIVDTSFALTEDEGTTGDLTVTIQGNYYNNSFPALQNNLMLRYRYKSNGNDWDTTGNTITADDGSYGWRELDVPDDCISGNWYSINITLSGVSYGDSYTFQALAYDYAWWTNWTPEVPAKILPVFDWGKNDFQFNVPVNCNDGANIKGYPVVDFVLDQGWADPWYYRKWYSGRVECWCRTGYTPTTEEINNQGGGQFYWTIWYPFTIYGNQPFIQGRDNCWYLRQPIYHQTETENQSIRIYLYPQGAESIQYVVDVFVVGRWY